MAWMEMRMRFVVLARHKWTMPWNGDVIRLKQDDE